MAITLTGTGGLFTRLGKIGHALNTVNAARGSTLPTELIDAVETLDAENDPVVRGSVGSLLPALASGQASLSGLASALRAAAEVLLIRQVHADTPLHDQTLPYALAELRRQMLVGDHYVDGNTVGATATQTGLDGDGVVVASARDPRGAALENLLVEDLQCRVTGVTTPGSELIEVRGEQAQGDKLHWLWPAGSGAVGRYTAIDAASASANRLQNGAFEDCTDDAFDNWTDDVGAWATDWNIEETTVYAGSKALKLVGDGATLAQISQDISARVAALRQYAVCLWARRDGSAAAAGVLTIDLYDGSGVIDDDDGTANSFTIDLTALTASYVPYVGVFRLPTIKPAAVHFRLRLSTALTDTRAVFFDHLSLGLMTQPIPANPGAVPYLAFFSGASPFSLNDYTGGGDGTRVFQVATANNRASDWQTLFDRFFNCSALGFTLPSAGSNLINDNLIG